MNTRLPVVLPPSDEFNRFIIENLKTNASELYLKYHDKQLNFNIDFAITQIICRQHAGKKLQHFLSNPLFLFPSTIASEQASNEAVSLYHKRLIEEQVSLLDMTAGLGIDLMSMSEKCSDAIGIEIDPLKAEILTYNYKLLGLHNMSVFCDDSVEWLKNCNKFFDVIFIDPSRRSESNNRSYNFHDCLPDIINHQNFIKKKCRKLMIKASPLLDITQTLKDISCVTVLRVICVNGECKEILIECEEDKREKNPDNKTNSFSVGNNILKEAIDLTDEGKVKSFFRVNSYQGEINRSETINYVHEKEIIKGMFLYEPNAGMMKLAPWHALCDKFPDLKKVAPSSHLFISENLYADFPGRILEIDKLIEKNDRKKLKDLPVNIVVRNYPKSVDELRKEFRVKEGMDTFLYATRTKKPILILAHRFQNLNPAVSTI